MSDTTMQVSRPNKHNFNPNNNQGKMLTWTIQNNECLLLFLNELIIWSHPNNIFFCKIKKNDFIKSNKILLGTFVLRASIPFFKPNSHGIPRSVPPTGGGG